MLIITPEFDKGHGRGFQLKLANGWTISVQFGEHNYCNSRENYQRGGVLNTGTGSFESPDAEIAAWDKNDVWYDFGDDKVKGYCSADEVVRFIHMISMKF